MKVQRVTVVGGGQMGRALIGGMFADGVLEPQNVTLVEPNSECRDWWNANHADVTTTDNLESAVAESVVVILAVKPNIVPIVAEQLVANAWQGKLVVSIAAGVSLNQLSSWIHHQRIVRVMPNTPSLVGEGASAFCCSRSVTDEDKSLVQSMLSSVGLVVEVNEYQMDAVTGLSGSGPAYICLVVEALADGGVLEGLPRPLAMKLAAQTVLGAAKMIRDTGRHPGELKDAVASPGGTTIAALQTLEQNAVRGAFIEAVQASAQRSAQLSADD